MADVFSSLQSLYLLMLPLPNSIVSSHSFPPLLSGPFLFSVLPHPYPSVQFEFNQFSFMFTLSAIAFCRIDSVSNKSTGLYLLSPRMKSRQG